MGTSHSSRTRSSLGRSVRAADSAFAKSAMGTPQASSIVRYAHPARFAAAAFWAGWMYPGCSSETTIAARAAIFASTPRASSPVRGRKNTWRRPRFAQSAASSRAHSSAKVWSLSFACG